VATAAGHVGSCTFDTPDDGALGSQSPINAAAAVTTPPRRIRGPLRVVTNLLGRLVNSVQPHGIDILLEVLRQTLVSSESVLFSGLGSNAVDETEAVLVIVPAALGFTTMSIVAEDPFVIVPRLHVTVPPDSVQEPWLGVAETNVTVGGNVSVTSTSEAASGPLLMTASVYVRSLPVATRPGEAAIARDKSATRRG